MKKVSYEMEELFPVVAMLAEQYTGYESTSVTYEKAEQFMGAVLYSIHAYEHATENALAGKKIPAREAYRKGVRILESKVKAMMTLYHEMLEQFCAYDNLCLEDTIIKGIPEFVKWYDVRYAPQDTILTLDYPILEDLSGLSGIDRIYAYVKDVSIEQKFLAGLGENHVREILNAYSADYQELIENISSIVLQNIVERMLEKATLTKQHFEQKQAYNTYLEKMIASFIKQYYDEDKEMLNYFRKDINNIRVRMSIRYQ